MPLTFRPKLDKIVELLLYLAHRRPGADKYQAVKFFYLADREHLIRHGRPITFEKYYALWYGPVASHAKELLERKQRTLAAAGIDALPFETEEVPHPTKPGETILKLSRPLREVDLDKFSKSDIEVFNEVIEQYGDLSFDDLYKITHAHFAYRNAWDHRRFYENRAEMYYTDMIEDDERKAQVLEDIGPISSNL